MDDDQFDTIMDEWASRQEEAAPHLEPPDDLRRRVVEQGRKGVAPAFPWILRWAGAAAALIMVAVLLYLLLCPSVPEGDPVDVVSVRIEKSVTFEGPRLDKPAMTRGPKRGSPLFKQVLLQLFRHGSQRITGIDLIVHPPEDLQLEVGDRYRLGLRPSKDIHVYVVQRSAQGELLSLFPNAAFSTAVNPLRGNEPHYLPGASRWLRLSQKRGEVRVHVLGSLEPIPDPEAALARPPDGVELIVFAMNRS
jgi:hypothetical protein